ncbi:MAG: phosphate signaling complex protein PhoU [Candidatus Goldbacteria bacterium]|nr:phosphate signaling complex protein PhoU [Candidatus Goldiibacteriota bacterium]
MERKFDEELQELKKKIFEMISVVNDLVEKSVSALINKDEKLADEVEKKDEEVDNFENDIDKYCMELLVRYQPAAIDLRFITSIMKINNDVERIGDLATTIAHKAKIIIKQGVVEIPMNITEIKKIIQNMFKDVTDALTEINPEKAMAICRIDKIIDEMYVETFRQILNLVIKNKMTVKAGIELILSIKYLERIADHITNIAEDIVYMAKGESIKHKGIKDG